AHIAGNAGANAKLLGLLPVNLQHRGRQTIEQVIQEYGPERSLPVRMIEEGNIVRQFLAGLHRIDAAEPVTSGVVAQDAVPCEVDQHAFGLVGGDVAKAMVVVLFVLNAQLAQVIEKEACEQSNTDTELQDVDVRLQVAGLFRLDQALEKDFGGIARQRAVVVDDKWNRRRIRN